MITEKELKLLRGLVEYHRTNLRYWNSEDEIDHEKLEAYQHFLELDEWLKVHGHLEKDDDILITLKHLDN